jgi:hypothetical protein
MRLRAAQINSIAYLVRRARLASGPSGLMTTRNSATASNVRNRGPANAGIFDGSGKSTMSILVRSRGGKILIDEMFGASLMLTYGR